ncbi:hypothetical protein LTS18_000298 [Coniosporium uncinatum]|uniref:Uncharacterized protein n=1 Tax=Coniosporium uncinatum TaxID=93489 RepID=A0ACC3D8C4_9PEZI|nr:hypothetical protein LTS18_000298 [Coniosporium uncinatum]
MSGLIVLMMFLRRKSIQHCIEAFDQLAKRTFSKRALPGGPFSRRIPTFMATWLKDGKYDPRPFESCLLEAFGEGQRMFDAADGAVSGTKVAVTAVTTRHSKLCILSNYNGLGPRSRGYKHFRADSFADEVLMCDAYFPAKFIPCLGWLQDGGVGKHNNPVDPAVWEGSAIWNTRQDLLVSIGTAFTEDAQSPTLPERKQKRSFRDGFLWRVLDYFLASGDSQTIWEEHWNRLDTEARKSHFRISAPLQKAPGLDEVDEMPNLKHLARTYMGSCDLSSIYRAMISASFFFELDAIPKFNQNTGMYDCTGSIRCRSPAPGPVVRGLIDRYPTAAVAITTGRTLGAIEESGLCQKCDRFRMPVGFRLFPGQSISMCLDFNAFYRSKISGFPNAVAWFVARQGLSDDSGVADHTTPISTGQTE